MNHSRKKPQLVGNLIRRRREELGLSQRALGQAFSPQVTTQFISNIERGITSLPPNHISTLSRVLQISEVEIMDVLEQEYAAKIAGQISSASNAASSNEENSAHRETELLRNLVAAYRHADRKTQETFLEICGTVLGLKVQVMSAAPELATEAVGVS